MADMINCPVCGESNAANLEFCQYCQSRLHPVAGSSNADTPITPGQIPTKKNTAELEPILPQWLRDARGNTGQSMPDDSADSASSVNEYSPPQRPIESRTPASPPDLLAGLQSQADSEDEDETPDWLASITGVSHKNKKSSPESSDAHRVELGGKDDFAQDNSQEETPDWLANLQAAPVESEKDELAAWLRTETEPKNTQSSEDSDWLKNLGEQSYQAGAEATPKNAQPSEDSDWLKSLGAQDAYASENAGEPKNAQSADDDDWLKNLGAQDYASGTDEPFKVSSDDANKESSFSGDTPDWLRQMDADANAGKEQAGASSQSDESASLPDWFTNQGAPLESQGQSLGEAIPSWMETGADKSEATEGASSEKDNAPDWLKEFGTVPAAADADNDWMKDLQQPAPQEPSFQGETPAWLKNDDAEAVSVPTWLSGKEGFSASQPAENTQPLGEAEPSFGDIPDWLKAAAPQSSIFEEPAAEAAAPSESSDWLSSLKSSETSQPEAMFTTDMQADSESVDAPAFSADAFSDKADDSLFQEMPDWLSTASDLPPSSTPTAITSADAISPGELPSWVQAMRPVDQGSAAISSAAMAAGEQTLETRGALSGLQGVLPAVPGYTPSSKPKVYSIRLQVSEEQQMHAELLEQILAAEAEPVPIASYLPLVASRGLRWLLAVVVFSTVLLMLSLRTQIFSMPLGMPAELGSAIQVIQAIPEGAPVLVATDYQPARAAEMEVAAAPVFDQMLLLRHPRLTFISTSETGGILTERFIAGPLAGHGYENRVSYLNLGYLPGGVMGIRAFSQNPAYATPYDISLQSAWDTAPVQGVSTFSQFAAVILMTDNADSARAWVEQTASMRGSVPFVVISSAQASPMIQPYYSSGQVNGLVSGLYGGALFEQNNAGRPGTARKYWDAYSISMLVAMAFMVIGGLWNMALGLRDRSAARERR